MRLQVDLTSFILVGALGGIGYLGFIYYKDRDAERKREAVAALVEGKRLEQERQMELDRQKNDLERAAINLKMLKEKEAGKQAYLLQREAMGAAERERIRQADLEKQQTAIAAHDKSLSEKQAAYLLTRKQALDTQLLAAQKDMLEVERERLDVAANQGLGPSDEQLKRIRRVAESQREYATRQREAAVVNLRNAESQFGREHETTRILKRRVDSLDREIERQNRILSNTKNSPRDTHALDEIDARKKEIAENINEVSRAYKDILDDPAYPELARIGHPIQIDAMIAENYATLRGEKDAPLSPAAEQPRVVEQKRRVIVITLADGSTIDATNTVESGELLTIKTVDGFFRDLPKKEIVKQESVER
jgi:hypothetical protein